jgi:ABC-2 type transport system ATP-binding protein
MSDRADTRTDTYSRGMLQRLGIADALVKDPTILILDEPTTSIDPLGVVEILELLNRLVEERGISILLSSHLLNQVQSVCSRIGIFAAGRLIGQGSVPELAHQFGEGVAHVEVSVEHDPRTEIEAVRTMFAAIPEVTDVAFDPLEGLWTLTVRPLEAERRVRHELVSRIAGAGMLLTSLRLLVPSLEDIYRRAVERAGLHDAAMARRAAAAGRPEVLPGELGAPTVPRKRLATKGGRRPRS